MQVLITLLPQLVLSKDKVPAADEVTAGWLGFIVFIGLILTVVILGRSLVVHLRRARDNAEAGAFGPYAEQPRLPQAPHQD